MIETLLVLILVFEVVRLILYIRDSMDVRERNEEAKKAMQRANEDWKSLRKAELEELKLLAKESDTMRQIYEEYKDKGRP